jgi:ribosomal protein S18 acetylase RimI-like enzyme
MAHDCAASPGLRVRRARGDDGAAIRRLLVALGYEAGGGPALPALLRDTLARPDLALFLATDRGDPAGTPLGLIGLSRRPQLHLGGTLVSIDALAVLPEARGRGVGRRLLRRARAYARLHRAVRLEVHTTRARENYRRGFYPSNGFREADSALFRIELEPIPARKQ